MPEIRTEIRAGDQISADYWPPAVQSDDGTVISNITNTSYAAGSPEVGVAFVAPKTGRVGIAVCGGMREDSAGNRVFMTYELFEGEDNTGVQILAPAGIHGISTSGATVATLDRALGALEMRQGLTPGTTYYARIMYLTEGGTTNDITRRRIIVFPLS